MNVVTAAQGVKETHTATSHRHAAPPADSQPYGAVIASIDRLAGNVRRWSGVSRV